MTASNLISQFASGQYVKGTDANNLVETERKNSNIAPFVTIGGAAVATASTTYVTVTGTTQAFTKLGSSTQSDVVAIGMVACRLSTAGPNAAFAINDGTTDWQFAIFVANTINEHNSTFGLVTLTGLAAGAYSFNMRAKVSSVTATVTVDAGDTAAMMFLEVPK
jgi:hypothetical protein